MKKTLTLILLLCPGGVAAAQAGLLGGEQGLTIDSAWAAGGAVQEHPEDPDFNLLLLWGGFEVRGGPVTLRGRRALLFLDKDDYRKGMKALLRGRKRPVSGGPVLPGPGREERLPGLRLLAEHFFRKGRREAGPELEKDLKKWLDTAGSGAVRAIYAEGQVNLWGGPSKILTAQRLHIDLADGSFTAEETTLRVPSTTPSGQESTLVIRAPLITEKGGRISCRDSSFTFCTFDKPHYQVAAGTIDGWKEGGLWVFRTTNNVLWIQKLPVLWLPWLKWREDEEGPLPLKSVKVGRKHQWGPYLFTVWGRSWRSWGEPLNRALGLPAKDFRGEWELTAGISRDRGIPLFGKLTYGSRDAYEGWLQGFWLDDRSDDHRGPVRTEWNGDPLPRNRNLLFTENRIHLTPGMKLDLQGWKAGDPGVIPEFYEPRHKYGELFETSAHWYWRAENRMLSALGQWDINDFSYRPDRALADHFDESVPSLAFFSAGEPLLTLPWGQQVILTVEAEAARFRRHYVPDLDRTDERVTRLYGEGELSFPFSLGPVRIRPRAALGGSHYDETIPGDRDSRLLAAAGVTASLHLSRFFPVSSEFWGIEGLLHQMDPEISWFTRFAPDEDPALLFTFDTKDRLVEQERVTLAFRNRLLTMHEVEGIRRPITLFRADLGLDFFPDAERDNNGNELGNLVFDLAWHPGDIGFRAPQGISLGARGAYDLEEKELDRLHLFGNVPVGSVAVGGGWVRGRDTDGTLYSNASITLLERWQTTFSYSYNLDRDLSTGYHLSLVRMDHDWALGLVMDYDEGEDDYRFNIEFRPGNWLVKEKPRFIGGINPMDNLM